MTTRVTALDIDSFEDQEVTIENDYVIIVDGTCYFEAKHDEDGNHVLTIKGRKNAL